MNQPGETPLRLEPFRLTDVELLLPIEEEAYPDPWTAGMFRQEAGNKTSHLYLAYAGEEFVGYAGFWLVLDEVHITKLTLLPSYRGVGWGMILLDALLKAAISLGAVNVSLEVREGNARARHLYARAGFEETGVRPGYYVRAKENAVLMSRRFQKHELGSCCVE